MQIDTAGTYLLKYTAEDECGNVTEVTREVVAEQLSYSTVLFADGTFIINEKSTDRDANIALHGAVTNEYIPFDPNGDTNIKKYKFSDYGNRSWNSVASSITAVEIGSPISPPSIAYWFANFEQCTQFDFTNLDTSETQNMQSAFFHCISVPAIDVSSFDTSNVTNMSSMFRECDALTSLDVSSFNTLSVTDMNNMFRSSDALTSLDLSTFDTSNVTNMSSMFEDCWAMSSINLSSFDTSNVTNMWGMFYHCFALTSLDVSSFNTLSVTNMRDMFSYCSELTTLDLSSFDTSSVTNMIGMFNLSTRLATIFVDATKFVVTQVSYSTKMFDYCNALVGGAGTAYASSNPKDKTYAHIDGGASNPGYFTAKVA